MARAVLRTIVFGLAATSFLMGCVEGGGDGGSGSTTIAGPAATKKSGKGSDVEAPEVFSTTDSALWDGRPSLGGIWVASPEVTDPERVVMVNTANGKTVTGALFRRERDNPGPRLQLSSDAAEALGILAGQPTEIKVTALRKEQAVEETPPEDTAADATATEATAPESKTDAAAPEAPAEKDNGEAAAVAAAALAAVDAAAPALADGKSADPAAEAAASAEGTAPPVEAAPKKTGKERRAEAKAAREAKKKAAAEAKAAAAAAEAAAKAGDAGTPPEGADSATAETAGVAAIATDPIESAPLDARKPEVAAGTADLPKPKAKAEPAAAAEPAKAEPVEAAPAASGATRPIQVASFSKEDNAKRAAEALAKIGITATPQQSEKNGKAVWGVVVMGDDAILKKIKDAGFADAYYLK